MKRLFFFFRAEDGIRDWSVTGVQTCALPIFGSVGGGVWKSTNCCTTSSTWSILTDDPLIGTTAIDALAIDPNNHNTIRSEERRVGKESRPNWRTYRSKKQRKTDKPVHRKYRK